MLQISELFIYPIKSFPGISLNEAQVTDRGFEHDRRWMLVNEQNVFLSQRELPQMVFFDLQIRADGLQVTYKKDNSAVLIPFKPLKNTLVEVTVWDDTCTGTYVSDNLDAWFTSKLGTPCRLVYMPDESHRLVDERYAKNNDITSFADAYPFLLIGQASLDELNGRLTESLHINRFRPNIVFTGGAPFEEDELAQFIVGNISFYGVKLCARCPIPTIDQSTGIRGKEPLKTLAGYRMRDNKVMFGQNLLHSGLGVVKVGDEMKR